MGRWRSFESEELVLGQVLELSQEVYGETGSKNLKRHAVSFTKGLDGASSMRVRLHPYRIRPSLEEKSAITSMVYVS